MLELAPDIFKRIVQIAHARWGIHLTERKVALVANRLSTYLRRTQRFESIDAYVRHLEDAADEEDMLVFFDLLSTNVTSFFRDQQHFHLLEREFWQPLVRGTIPSNNRRVRLWSAACSTGCEPYSMAIQALDMLPEISRWDVKILATDLSNKALAAARAGVYPDAEVAAVSEELREKHFERVTHGGQRCWRVADHVRELVTIRQVNLMEPYPFRGPFDVVFLRNVMIYFDRETRESLVRRIAGYLRPGGFLAVGGAETLSGLDVPLRPLSAGVYVQ
ncbi:MAG: protein-glutamate O-methyltransferase CheR [Phycisphaerales bacterium]